MRDYLLLLFYSLGAVLLSITTMLPFSVVLVLLFAVPLFLLLRQGKISLGSLVAAALGGAAVLLLLEAFAHFTGSWYTLAPSTWRLFSTVSLESVLFAFFHTFYFLALYEHFFDDNKSEKLEINRLAWLVLWLAVLGIAYTYLFAVAVVSYALSWLLFVLLAAVLGALVLAKVPNKSALLIKISWFGILVWPLSLLFELVAMHYGVRVFAFSNDYLASLNFAGYEVPVEEMLLLFALPVVLALVYELFVDNRK